MKAFTAEELQKATSLENLRKFTLVRMQKELSEFCLNVTTYDVRDIDFSPEYIATIEAQQIAEEKIQTASFQADAEEEKARGKIIAAQGDAEALRIDAQAKADALVINAEAQAEAIQEIGLQLERYDSYIQLQFVEQLKNVDWGILPDGAIPLIQMDTPAP
jgi:regulator of protease activity HflC (stomatin/prohibitin superfamily)